MLSIDELRDALMAVAVHENAAPMSKYMRDQFEFLGVKSQPRKALSKPFFAAAKTASTDDLIAFVDACWAEPEREFQYVGCELLRREAKRFEPERLDDLARYVTTGSWWDTVDGLAAWVVGPLVAREPDLVHVMDDWAEDENMWLARSAILHQLGYKGRTDAARLFSYAEALAPHTDFFIRKAIGWSLRQYGRTDPEAVRAFVSDHGDDLSGLTKREALKHL